MTGVIAVEEVNRQLARRWFVEGWCRGNVELAEEIFAEDFVLAGRVVGPVGPRRSVQAIHASFSDIEIDINLQLAEGDMVATHFTTRATHTADYAGIPATGKRITASGIVIWRIVDGMVVRDWNQFDEFGLRAQLL